VEVGSGADVGEELLGGAVGGVPAEALLQVEAEDAGHLGAKGIGIGKETEGGIKVAEGADIRGEGRRGRWGKEAPGLTGAPGFPQEISGDQDKDDQSGGDEDFGPGQDAEGSDDIAEAGLGVGEVGRGVGDGR
jgi:hypothetical protein